MSPYRLHSDLPLDLDMTGVVPEDSDTFLPQGDLSKMVRRSL